MRPQGGRQHRTCAQRRNALAALLAVLAAALLALPGAASAATRGKPYSASTLQLPAPSGAHADALVQGRPRRLSRLGGSANEGSYPVLGGQVVDVSSTYYGPTEMQAVANVLGGLVHGAEMDSLSAYLATPDEINQICGEGALACYAPTLGLMIVAGLDGSSYGVPRDYTIAHEYGHHVANYRLNAPWTALETGAKRWATYTRVCQGVRRGQLYPGDQGAHYWDNPGEAFAETNAHLNYPGVVVPWGYSPLLSPNLRSMARLRSDIESPWSSAATLTWHGRLWRQRERPARRRFSTPLDGMVEIRLEGAPGTNYDLYVLGDRLPVAKKHGRQGRKHRHGKRPRPRRRVLQRAASSGSSEQLLLENCGRESLHVEVRRRGGSGSFRLQVTRP